MKYIATKDFYGVTPRGGYRKYEAGHEYELPPALATTFLAGGLVKVAEPKKDTEPLPANKAEKKPQAKKEYSAADGAKKEYAE